MGAKWNGKERERHFTEPETGTFWSWTWMEFYVCCDCGTIVEFEVGAKMCRAFCCVWSGVLHASINTTRTTAYTRETKRGKEREQSQRWSVWLDSRHFRANLRAVDDFERKIKRTVRFQFEIVWSWKPNMNLLEQKPNSTHNNTRSTNKQTNVIIYTNMSQFSIVSMLRINIFWFRLIKQLQLWNENIEWTRHTYIFVFHHPKDCYRVKPFVHCMLNGGKLSDIFLFNVAWHTKCVYVCALTSAYQHSHSSLACRIHWADKSWKWFHVASESFYFRYIQ